VASPDPDNYKTNRRKNALWKRNNNEQKKCAVCGRGMARPSSVMISFQARFLRVSWTKIHVARFFNAYYPHLPKRSSIWASARGGSWFGIDKLRNLSQVVGIDYSRGMVSFCSRIARSLRHRLVCKKDNLLELKNPAASLSRAY